MTSEQGPRLRRALHLLAGCLLLGAVAFNTAPERVIAETKLDMALNPLGFLARSLHLWEGSYFGHLQNQAYGYLFPMGPFYSFWLWLDMPAWMVQRLWLTTVMSAAFVGLFLLARALGIGGHTSRLVAALGYALAPHALALIGANSSEFLPSAVLPWILLPLARGTEAGASPRRAALLSALAFVCCGGVNAVAEAAVLAVPLLYLLTRSAGPRRRRLLAWWLSAVAVVSLWWLLPLLIMGRYIFSFLPFIETTSATSGITSLTNILRGANQWLSFLQVEGQPVSPAAFELATGPLLIVGTAALAALGVAGLLRRGTPERLFLLLTLLAGVLVMSAGYLSELSGLWSVQLRDLLDGPLAPFRNLHKFDALVRLPLLLGLAALPSARPARVRGALVAAAAGLVAVVAAPVALVGVSPAGSFTDIPGYWREAASWLDERAGDGMVLAVPGSRRGEYTWGRPMDEPLQALLTKARWANHTTVPWGSAGVARLMAAVDQRISAGQGSAGLTAALRRIGVRYLLVRNDLDRSTIGEAWPGRVHEALDASPGISRVRGFGPQQGYAEGHIASGWLDQPYDAIEIYAVGEATPLVSTVPKAETLRVLGGPEAMLALAEQDLLGGDRPVLLGDDPGAADIPKARTILTDTLRRRELVTSDLRQNASPTLTATEPPVRWAPTADLLDPGWSAAMTTAGYLGVREIAASSSDADANAAAAAREPGRLPYAAMDGDLRTSWRSNGWNGALGEWLEVRLLQPARLGQVRIALDWEVTGLEVTELEIETDAGLVTAAVEAGREWQSLTPPPGQTTRLRVRVARAAAGAGGLGRIGVRELAISGVRAGRTLLLPEGSASTVLMTRNDEAAPCMRASISWSCAARLERRSEDGYGFDRTFTAEAGEREITGRAVLTAPVTLQQFTAFPDRYPQVTASSTMADHGAALGRNAFDGDMSTLWFAHPSDRRPSLRVDLGRTQRLTRIQVLFPDYRLGGPPVRVTVRAGREVRSGYVDDKGWLTFAALRARELEIGFAAAASRAIEVAELRIPGVQPVGSVEKVPLRLPCGLGPVLTVNGRSVLTRVVSGTMGDALAGRPVGFRSCGEPPGAAGPVRVSVSAEDPYRIRSLAFSPAGAAARRVVATAAQRVRWTPAERQVRVHVAAASYLVVNENHNAGWTATLDGEPLTPVRLDGWRQAWELPPGADGLVTMRYEPDAAYRLSLFGGLAAILLTALVAAAPGLPGPLRGGGNLPAAAPGGIGRWWPAPFAPLVGLALGGWPGLVAVTGAFLLGVREPPRGRVAGLLLGLAGLSLAAGSWWGDGLWADLVPQSLCLLLVGLLLAALSRRRE